MKRVCVLGHFAFGKTAVNGQTIKTKIVTDELVRQLGETEVRTVDTHGGAKTLFKAPFQVLSAFKTATNVVILPAHNGVRVYGRLLPLVQKLFKGRKIHYVVIGGWLPELLKSRRGLSAALKKFDGIYVETNTMKTALENQGFSNVYVMPNCKELTALEEVDLACQSEMPLKLCTFSRVNVQKGIEDAVNCVKQINKESGKTVYSLDIYGQVDAGQKAWFEGLQAAFPEYIHYHGTVPFNQSVEVLKNYFALLFPTRYYTEGIPGTIIDAYAAGVPVISAQWQSFADIVDDGATGIGYNFGSTEELKEKLIYAAEHLDEINALKPNCLKKSKCFIPEAAIKVIVNELA